MFAFYVLVFIHMITLHSSARTPINIIHFNCYFFKQIEKTRACKILSD